MIKSFLTLLTAFTLQAHALPVIVDTDMGNDDVMAILGLLHKPNIDVKAITIVGTGLAHAKEGHLNARKLLQFLDKKEIPTAIGRSTPQKGGNFFPDSWREYSDGLLEHIALEDEVIHTNAIDLLKETIESSPEKITILALGLLTNLAELFQTHPHLISKIEKIQIMGGAVDVPGNLLFVKDNQTAEWNIFADPIAAKEVFESGIPIHLIALDVTNQVPLTVEYFNHIEKNQKTPAATLFYLLLKSVKDMGEFYFWDLQAVETLADPTLAHFEKRYVEVIIEEGPNYGQTAPSEKGHPIHLATKIDAARFLNTYFDTINEQN